MIDTKYKKNVINILKKNGFKFLDKQQSELIKKSDIFKDSYNYIFIKLKQWRFLNDKLKKVAIIIQLEWAVVGF